jgi:hypothetical protein
MNLAHISKNFYSNFNVKQMKHVTKTVLVLTYNLNEYNSGTRNTILIPKTTMTWHSNFIDPQSLADST